MAVWQSRSKYICAAILLSASSPAFSAEELAATPYRPSVSNPARLPVPGFLEFEVGVEQTTSGAERRGSVPFLIKYAFNESIGVLLGGDGFVRERSAFGERVEGVGDTAVTLKLHHAVNDAVGVGLEAGTKLPTANKRIGSHKPDFGVAGIVSIALGEADLDINLGVARIGAIGPAESNLARALAAAISHPLAEKWAITGELSTVRRRGTERDSQFLTAVGYNLSKAVVIDAGVAWGLTHSSTDRSIFAGVTILLK